jgi:hypothetical protein
MINEGQLFGDLAALLVPAVGGLADTGDRYEPYRLVDANGTVVEAATFFFRDLLASGRGGVHGPFVWDGSSSLVPIPLGSWGCLGSCDAG